MVSKDITGKFGRFLKGRIAAFREEGSHRSIPSSCLYFFPPNNDGGVKTTHGKPLVIFYSGDGGWANLTSQVSPILRGTGYPVVGIDCMHYFWKEKEPDVAGAELSELIDEMSAQWKTSGIILLGYSMGADVLPLICRHLPEKTIDQVERMILISPSHRVQLKFRFIGWLGFETPKHAGVPLMPELKALAKRFPVSCISGEKEKGCLGSELPAQIAHTQALPGGHHFEGDYPSLAECILSEIARDGTL
jgi:type IV secretory pathway VirJ component